MVDPHEGQDRDNVMKLLADSQQGNLLLEVQNHDPEDNSPIYIMASDTNADPVRHLVAMKHTHLPMLEAYGFINWYKTHHEVTKGSNFDQVEPLLRHRSSPTDR